METISIDIETFSDINLAECGVYKYAQSPDFEILLFGYSVDGGTIHVVDLANDEKIPDKILKALSDDRVIKWAFNANFERICLSEYLNRYYPEYFQSYSINEDTVNDYLDPASWRCTMIWSAYLGLPLSLKGVGAVLKLDAQKMDEGKELIKYFCVPCVPTKSNGGRLRNYPHHDFEKWELFKKYNKRDVEVELAVKKKLTRFPVPEFVWEEYHLDQQINDRGIAVDMKLVSQAVRLDEKCRTESLERARELTGLDNPNSPVQLLEWLNTQGVHAESLDKKTVQELLKTATGKVREVLLLRQQLSKSSVKKYTAMNNVACDDSRARGCFQFYGANRTGRWSGRNIQLQNLPQNHIPDLEQARNLVKSGNYAVLDILYENIPDTLSQLIRTAFVPRKNMKFIVADFSAIEARVIAWLAGERWRMEAFADGKDIYCASASQMFHVPVEKHGVNGHLRQKGKIAELACIAEGQLVLTDYGLIPIEKVTKNHRLWDGENWVTHDGVIYKGEREVLTYDGLTATPDHLVWIKGQTKPVQFGVAAASGSHLIQTGDGRKAIRLGKNYQSGETLEQSNEPLLCTDRMHRVWFGTMDVTHKSYKRKIQRLSAMFSVEENSEVVGQTTYCCKTTMRKSERCRVSQLGCKRNPIRFSECNCRRTVSDFSFWMSGKSNGDRQNRQQWKLRTGQSAICISYRKQSEQTHNSAFRVQSEVLALCVHHSDSQAVKRVDEERDYSGSGSGSNEKKEMLATHIRKARLYDIRNAGQHHRFTVSGKLVHNCGYGGSVGAMKAMGGAEMGLSDEELKKIVADWREASPNIVKLWWDVDRAVKECIRLRLPTETHGLKFSYESGFLFIELPSGRRLAYVKPRIEPNQFGGESVTYEGVGTTKKWGRIESYGPKFVENCVQSIARDLLCHSMKTLSSCFMVATVHDEIIIEADKRMSLETVCKQMSRTPPWADGLLLRADGYECKFYKKD